MIDINKELSQNFIDFSYEANSQRAFADARDGLKPGQRACLWEMYSKGYTSNKPHVKSAKISGGTIASWWPHGSTAIYDTFARMSQSWINNIPEVDWHGANGSIQISGEPAADRYCVTGDTLIKTNKGTIPIRDLVEYVDEDENLKDIYIYDFRGNKVPATKFFNSGFHPTLTVTLKNRQKISITKNHPLLVLSKNDCGLLWKTGETLEIGDKVVIPLFNYNQDNNQIDLKSGSIESKMLGCMISEGYITTQNRIGINNTDLEMIYPVKEFFESQIPELKATINKNQSRNYYEYCIANKKYYEYFITKYQYKDNAKDKKIPKIVWSFSHEDKSAFLRYLFEGDGGIVGADSSSARIIYSSYSENLVQQLQIMLIQDFQIFSSISSSKRKSGIEYKLNISGPSLKTWEQKIGFVSDRKNQALALSIKNYDNNAIIANGSYYSTTEFSIYIRTLTSNKFCQTHAFSNIKNFYKCRDYIDPCNFDRLYNLINNYIFVPISSIELNSTEEEVFSVRVDNPASEHSFIANGFINHNTEARLSKSSEEGLFCGIKKKNVPMKLNFSEDDEWPEVLPAIYPRLIVNGCQGIGSTIANVWLPHSLDEIAASIQNYLSTGEIDYEKLAPSFPSGGIIINKKDLASIYRTGKGKVILRGKTEIDKNYIYISELPYQVYVEPFIENVKQLIMKEEIIGISNILNKSNKKQLLIEIECDGSPENVLNQLFSKTDLQKSYSANQYALVGKTPKFLTYKEYLDIYLNHNYECIRREFTYDLEKSQKRLEIVEGLIKALEDIDNIIHLIKNSESSSQACQQLIEKYEFTEAQAKAIIDMKLGRLAHLEKIELNKEQKELTSTILDCQDIISSSERQKSIYLERFTTFVKKYPNPRKTELTQFTPLSKEEKEIAFVEPEKCVVIMTEAGNIKRIPATSFRNQKRNGKGVKTQDDITHAVIRTNTVDNLMIFSDKGKMYRLLVDNVPVGTNVSKGTSIKSLVEMDANEKPVVIYSINRDTDAEYVLFATKNGLVKKTALSEYFGAAKRKGGVSATKLRDGDELISVALMKNENLLLVTSGGMCVRIKGEDITVQGKAGTGTKGITLKDGDSLVAALPIRDAKDDLAVFAADGIGKRISLDEFPVQNRAGKGLICYKGTSQVATAALVNDDDSVLILGDKNSICVAASEIPVLSRVAGGNQIIKGSRILSVSKV